MSTRHIDVSHEVEHGMVTYKGLPAPVICDFLSREASRKLYAGDTTFHIGRIDMVANTGTYVDAPFHRYENGRDLAALPLTSLADREAVIFRVEPGVRAIGADTFAGCDVRGKAVLIHTGWDRHWRTEQWFSAVPVKVRAFGTFPVRAYVRVER